MYVYIYILKYMCVYIYTNVHVCVYISRRTPPDVLAEFENLGNKLAHIRGIGVTWVQAYKQVAVVKTGYKASKKGSDDEDDDDDDEDDADVEDGKDEESRHVMSDASKV